MCGGEGFFSDLKFEEVSRFCRQHVRLLDVRRISDESSARAERHLDHLQRPHLRVAQPGELLFTYNCLVCWVSVEQTECKCCVGVCRNKVAAKLFHPASHLPTRRTNLCSPVLTWPAVGAAAAAALFRARRGP